ncbi:endonuclease YncB(thermonuclease family) [Methylorubrum rhodinum]|uniref:Endonuclease YncB(Thermonuclease family) n=1 Tax=Methylorubrum rhodinum TaxID=29428 RepID=A0A840ZMW1_9HYPH|nr:thermonuclease family protein [Methylorubrum rhodinum]MBB5759532.1 endonuclease YncB(thermonuclease family) [Methylorubrum rhodinum]
MIVATRARTVLAVLSISAALCGPAGADEADAGDAVTGRAAVIEGDTLRLRGQVVGLYGIVAPAPGAACESARGASIRCGAAAARALAERIGEGSLACEPRGRDRFDRLLAVCRKEGEDLGAWMVESGHAVADRFHVRDYVAHEARAWSRRRGLWAGVFADPTERGRVPYSAKRVSALDP